MRENSSVWFYILGDEILPILKTMWSLRIFAPGELLSKYSIRPERQVGMKKKKYHKVTYSEIYIM